MPTKKPKPEAKAEPQPNAQPNAQTNAQTNAQPNAQPGAQTNAQPNAQPGAQTNAQPNAQPGAQTNAQPSAQVKPPTNPDPADPTVQAAPSAAAVTPSLNETLKPAMWEALMNTTWDQTLSQDHFAEFRKGTEAEASVWLYGPARLQILTLADRRLANCANAMRLESIPIEEVAKLHGRFVPGTSYFVIRPAAKGDHSATLVRRYEGDSSAWANFIKVIGPTQFRVETGWKERYAVAYIPKGSPLGPGIVIDLSEPLERKPARKAKEEETEGEEE